MRRVSTAPIGWPGSTIEYTLIEMGGVLISGEGQRSPAPLPEHIVDVERAICALPPEMKRVVVLHYMTRARTKEKAEIIGSSLKKYHCMIDNAHAWLDGYFSERSNEERKAS